MPMSEWGWTLSQELFHYTEGFIAMVGGTVTGGILINAVIGNVSYYDIIEPAEVTATVLLDMGIRYKTGLGFTERLHYRLGAGFEKVGKTWKYLKGMRMWSEKS